MRKFVEPKLLVATHNNGKLEEIIRLLEPYGIAITSNAELGLPEPEETEDNFIGNARIKAHAAAKSSGLPALADDSGIVVDALGGEPGVYTADWSETPGQQKCTQLINCQPPDLRTCVGQFGMRAGVMVARHAVQTAHLHAEATYSHEQDWAGRR